jgi:hypothetical protein
VGGGGVGVVGAGEEAGGAGGWGLMMVGRRLDGLAGNVTQVTVEFGGFGLTAPPPLRGLASTRRATSVPIKEPITYAYQAMVCPPSAK